MRKSRRVIRKSSLQVPVKSTPIRRRSWYKNLKYALIFSLFGLLSFVFSANVYAASYELLFNKDLPGVSSLVKSSDTDSLSRFAGSNNSVNKSDTNFVGDNGTPLELRLPSVSARVFVVPAIRSQGGDFLIRAGTAHYLLTSAAQNGAMGNLVIYARRDWRSLPETASLSIDDNIFVDTNKDWRYVYRVTEAKKGSEAEKYLLPTSQRASLLLVVEGKSGLEVYRAENMSLQNIGR